MIILSMTPWLQTLELSLGGRGLGARIGFAEGPDGFL